MSGLKRLSDSGGAGSIAIQYGSAVVLSAVRLS
jgi:hypothetical protein